jgi:regulator of replication initiation timing
MDMQDQLKEYDHQNKKLNRQVLELLQENTKLKMEKVQTNIINILPSSDCKKIVQKICSKRIDEF